MNLAGPYQDWEIAFISKKPFYKRLIFAFIAAILGLCAVYTITSLTGLYFSSLIITIVIIISLYSGFFIAVPFAIVLGLIADYYFLQPIGSIFDSVQGVEHFIIVTGITIFVSYLIAKLRSSFHKIDMSKKEAVEGALMMEKVLALVSHDVRTPLTITKMGVQSVIKHPENVEKNAIILQKTLKSLEMIESMTQSLLDVSRIRSGKTIPLDFEHCDLKTRVTHMYEDMLPSYGDRLQLSYSVISLNGTWATNGIRRALENLITNAIKYGSMNTPIIINLEEAKGFALLSVHNDGREISKDEQEKLFDSFHRTAEAEQSKVKGWGLGLALVKGVAEAHDGEVLVSSSEGKGTLFTLKLPIK
ncbi:MAG: HAMP domain-containing histidine kinase [Rhizobacter sp.]|nr:HAMP domain-containing histidine kinase [Bacteriovorax sp.]